MTAFLPDDLPAVVLEPLQHVADLHREAAGRCLIQLLYGFRQCPASGHAAPSGWAGTKNSALLKRADEVCDVFVTMDGNIERQQNLASLPFGVVVMGAPSNRMTDLLPVVPELLQVIDTVRPGGVAHVGRSSGRRG